MTRGVAVAVLLLIGCASAAPQKKTAPQDEPEVLIWQISSVGEAARHITGPISVQFRVEVGNHSNEPITVKRVDLISIGSGAYTLRATSVPADARLLPGETTSLQFWSPAYIDDPTILGANGPVTLRATVFYDTPAGATQTIVVRQVHPNAGGG